MDCVENISKTLAAWTERLQGLKLEEKVFFQLAPTGPTSSVQFLGPLYI